MKSIIYILGISFFSVFAVTAQVGINTESPVGKLHISTSPLMTNTPASDVVFDANQNGNAYLGIGTTTIPSTAGTQLELKSSKKAFMPNRVSLTGTADVTTIPNPQDGMFAYNTSTVSDVTPGLYQYHNARWRRIITRQSPQLAIQRVTNAGQDTPAKTATNYTGLLFPFSDAQIYEDGSYAFAVRLYGRAGSSTLTTEVRGTYYIWLLDNNNVPLDMAVINPVIYREDNHITATVVLGANNLTKGQSVKIGLAHDSSTGYRWNIANYSGGNQNTYFYWKVESFSPELQP